MNQSNALMKKLLFVVVVLISATTIKAQSLTLGVNAGLPTGELKDLTNFQLGADVAYRYGLANILEVGPMVGYSHFFGESVEVGEERLEAGDVQFVPVAASARLSLVSFTAGLDLGYALGLSDGHDGGLYYRPSVGFNILMIGLIASYQGISSDGGTVSSINLGVEFGL